MKKNSIIVLGALFALIILVAIATNVTKNPEYVQPTSSSSSSTSILPTSSSTTTSTVSESVLEYDSIYTVSTPGNKVLVGIRANPRTAIVSFTTIIYSNAMLQTYYVTITYSVVDDTTTEILTQSDIMNTHVVTAIGISTIAVITYDDTTITDSSWKPVIFRVFEPFSPYVVKDSTTYFTMGGDILETTTLTEWDTLASISHVYTKVFDGTTIEKTVIMNGLMYDYSTSVSISVFTDFPTYKYPWISDNTTIIPVMMLGGIIEREHTVMQQSETRTEMEFYSVTGNSVPTYFVGYQAGYVSSVTGSNVVVYYGSVALTGTNVGNGVFIVTFSDLLSSGAEPNTSTVTDFINNFYILRNFVSMTTMLANNTPVLIVDYVDAGLTFTMTFDRDYAVVRGIYRVVTDQSGGYIVLQTFAVYNMDIVGITKIESK